MDDMTQHNTNPGPVSGVEQALRRDVLISRIIDGEDDGRAWSEYAQIAVMDVNAWRELAQAQREHAALQQAVMREISIADEVELASSSHGASNQHAARLSRWGGWAAAAAVGVTWLGTQFSAIQQSRTQEIMTNTASVIPMSGLQVDSPQDAISAYKTLGQRSGTVLGEIPDRVIVESRPLGGGRGYEVVYLRQFMERAQVAELYQVTHDDSGQQGVLVPMAQSTVKPSIRID